MTESNDPVESQSSSMIALLESSRAGSDQSWTGLMLELRHYLTLVAGEHFDSQLEAKISVSDIVQQSYAKALERIDDFRGTTDAEMRGWLRQIAVNEIRQLRRDFGRPKRDIRCEKQIDTTADSAATHQDLIDDQPTPMTNAVAREEEQALYWAMKRLSRDHQTVLKLRNWERMEFKEIAERMDRSVQAVKKLWYRAVSRLKHVLKGYRDQSNRP